MEIAEVKEQADKICENISRVLIGREKEIRVILAALFAGGHVLVVDRPGTGKTLLAKTFAKSIGSLREFSSHLILCHPTLQA